MYGNWRAALVDHKNKRKRRRLHGAAELGNRLRRHIRASHPQTGFSPYVRAMT